MTARVLLWMLLAAGGLGAVGALAAWRWAGPSFRVDSVELTPPATPGAPYQVEARILNAGLGRGEADVSVRLHSAKTRETFLEMRKVELKPREASHLFVLIDAPPGQYTAEVEAHNP